MSPAGAPSQTRSSDDPIQTILVVEDEVLVRLPLAEYLRDCGFRVFEAANVTEAKAVLNTNTPIDLVFSDVNLPEAEEGFELASWIRQNRPDVKVLLASGAASAAKKAGDLCMDGPMLSKPYAYTEVLRRIQTLIRKAGRGAASE